MELYGKKALLDNIDSIEKVDLLNNNRQIIEMLKQKNIKYSFNPKKFVELDKALNHQGIIAYSKNKQIFKTIDEYLKVHADNSLIVILDSILDPRNFGSILRSCEAFGIDCVIYKKDNQAQIDEFVIKTSQGAINNLNLIKVINLSQTLDKLKESGFWIYSSVLNEKSKNYQKIDYDSKSVLVIGSEENGVSKNLIDKSDFLIKIPMCGKTQSLNVSVACGILLSNIRK